MATLKFGKANSLVGFSSLKTSRFNNLPPARIVRELVQNSLDAAKEAGVSPAIVRFGVRKARMSDVPDFQGHSRAVQKAMEHHKKESGGKLPEPAQEAVNRINDGLDAVKKGKASLLSVTDNGIGLDAKKDAIPLGRRRQHQTGPPHRSIWGRPPRPTGAIRHQVHAIRRRHEGRKTHGVRVDYSRFPPREAPPPRRRRLPDKRLQKRAPRRVVRLPAPKPTSQSHQKGPGQDCSKEWGHGSSVMVLAFNNFRSGGIPLLGGSLKDRLVQFLPCSLPWRTDSRGRG